MKNLAKVTLGATLLLCGMTAFAQKDPDVGGVPMFPKKTIVENAAASPIHKTLVNAIQAAGLADALNGNDRFTVFAPTDDAFAKLPAGTLSSLEQPGNKDRLTRLLTYHVVPGNIRTKQLAKMIKKGHGVATLKTLQGGVLTVKRIGSLFALTDEKGGTAVITTADVFQKNGVIHVVDAVLMPS